MASGALSCFRMGIGIFLFFDDFLSGNMNGAEGMREESTGDVHVGLRLRTVLKRLCSYLCEKIHGKFSIVIIQTLKSNPFGAWLREDGTFLM